jgi:hypothetical protein
MTTLTNWPARYGRARMVRTLWAVVAVALVAGGGYAWATHDNSPSCSWPMRIRGDAPAPQAGVVRCYLRALAQRDLSGLYRIADYIPKNHITTAAFAHSADARSGLATVSFAPATISVSWVGLRITFADGAVEVTGLTNMQAMGGPSTWRMAIGSNE